MKNNYKQWVADVYHCSDVWGTKVTDEEMKTLLEESHIQAGTGDYVPEVSLYKQCAAYWNKLCDLYPQ